MGRAPETMLQTRNASPNKLPKVGKVQDEFREKDLEVARKKAVASSTAEDVAIMQQVA
ncbi:MAG: hypothetical protein ACI8PB_002434 [Desulforhopalus sp.]|jgi:hypothetical protein